MRVFVKAAGHYLAIPSDDATVPHFPTFVEQTMLHGIGSVVILFVSRKFFVDGNQVGAVFKIINLSRLQFDFIDSKVAGQLLDVFDLMLVMLHYKKLKNYMWCRR